MKQKIIDNLFGLWKHIGEKGKILHVTDDYLFVRSKNNSWPSIVFELKNEEDMFKNLHHEIENQTLPNSISIFEDKALETALLENKFMLKSTVKGMYLNLIEKPKSNHDFDSIYKVDNEQRATEFARIASKSFGYEILDSTITPLINSSSLKLFIGKHNDHYVSCGMLLLDSDNISGIHMIGTTPEYRGLGLGKTMTHKLLLEAFENKSDMVVLVASEAGERIYSKLGFISDGSLKSFRIKDKVELQQS
ncbi:GNAT family N-acetyltransferase [Aquimarina gracilis]|uniref:GNAT family N-acetyltransferase n=1 Tax=Aquimarina gracilis TaxID=874422 RepID=A0ABU5ZS18_9FLAO|nr:GNAT family N-acetyltransferase [Aquimarina gracilis]MEB3344749.1 GNAT family N-acetyltransferase [Aquimarina gracilis]